MSGLPTLLAGPLVRRCDLTELNLWFATSRDVPIGASIEAAGAGASTPVAVMTQQQVSRVAANLWIHLLTITPLASTFPIDRILLYRTGVGGPAGTLEPFDDPEEQADLLYPGFDRTSLLLQGDRYPGLNALHGSCRKSHGLGPDATVAADALMARRINDLAGRPHVLLLGGDQIYADDVAEALSGPIRDLAARLVGMDEPIPGMASPASMALGARQKLINDAHMTSEQGGNHLLTFGEFCAAYLLAWNPGLWPSFETMWDHPEELMPALTVEDREKIRGQWNAIQSYRSGAKALRRLMANVSTYMAFDDHEITDDWFLNRRWKAEVMSSNTGRRIIANGLAAFWLFQAIGNWPSVFYHPSAAQVILDHMTALRPGGTARSQKSGRFDEFFGQQRTWSFVTATRPGVICLDTRTNRTASTNRTHTVHQVDRLVPLVKNRSFAPQAPRLMDPKELDRLRRLVEKQLANDSRLVLLAPTPVLGFGRVEGVAEFFVKHRVITAAGADLESFHADPNSYLDLVSVLFNQKAPGGGDGSGRRSPELVVILSGDVHYGFSVAAALKDLTSSAPAIAVAQFTSSAAKNQADGAIGAGLKVLATKLGMTGDVARFLWRSDKDGGRMSSLVIPSQLAKSPISLSRSQIGDLVSSVQSQSAGATLRFAEVFRFAMPDGSLVVEEESNMGLLEISGYRVKNRLLKWDGGLQQTLETDWNARSGWPVRFTP